MSETIDNRVVQMRFDNEQFERGIQTSIRSIKKLDDSMDFENGVKSFRQLDEVTKHIGFDRIISGLDKIASQFTFIGQLGLRLKNEVIDKMVVSGERLVQSLSMDQVSVGWDKYADKTSAVQTIMSATAKEFSDTATQMAYVNQQLEQLTWFTDETSYNFLDMVSNIGKFTNMNIPLDEASTSMQGIAVWAAKSGANANEASRAMYNISQSLGTGAMRLQDWMSIENANMATAEFKETAIQTAVALGTLTKSADGVYKTIAGNEVTVQNFRENLKDNWLSAEVLTTTLTRYGGAVEELNKLYNDLDGSITTSTLVKYIDEFTEGTLDLDAAAEEMGMTVDEVKERLGVFNTEAMQFSLKAFKAAQEAKTFAEALNSVKDAVSSKWMQSFEYIFGDYEQAKELWTDLANTLYDIFATSGDIRNEMLALWSVMEIGGRETLIDSLKAALSAVLRLIIPVKEGFEAIFPPVTAERLAELVEGFHKLMLAAQLSDEQMDKLSRVFRGVFSAADIVLTVIKQLAEAGFNALREILGLLNIDILETAGSFGDMIYNFRNFVKSVNIFEEAGKALTSLFEKITKSAQDFQAQLLEEHPELNNIFGQLTDAARKAYDDFTKIVEAIKNTIARFGKDGDIELPKIRKLEDLKAAFDLIVSVVDEEIKKIWTSFQGLGELFNKEKDAPGLLDILTGAFKRFGDIFAKVGKVISQYLPDFNAINIALFATAAGTIYAVSKIADAMMFFAKVLKGFSGIGVATTKAIDALRGVFVEYQKNLKADRIRNIALSIGVLIAEMIVLAYIPTDKLIKAGVAMLGLSTILVVMFAALKKIGDVKGVTASILSISAALALLAIALNSIKVDLENPQEIIIRLGALITLMVILVAYMKQVQKAAPQIQKGAVSMISLGASLILMVYALKKLSQLDAKSVAAQIPNIVVLVAALLALEKLFGTRTVVGNGSGVQIFNSKATSLISMALSLILIVQAFKALSKLDPASIVTGIVATTAMFGAMSVLMMASKLAGEHAAKAGVMLMAVSVALNLMVFAIKGLGNLDPGLIPSATASLVAMLAFFSLMTAASKLSGENAHKAGLMFLEAAAAITLLTLAIQALGKIPTDELVKGTGAITVLILAFSAMVALSRSADYAKKTITTVAVVLGILTAMIIGLSFVDDSKVIAIGGALSALMVAMGILAKGMDDVKVGFKSAMTLTLVVGILGGILTLMSQWANPESIIPIATGLSVLLLGVASSIAILSVIGRTGAQAADSALPVIAKIGIVLLALVGIVGLFNELTDGKVGEVIERTAPVMQKLGEAIGGFIGGIGGGLIAGGTEAILSKLPQWGQYLSDFSTNLTGFLSMLDLVANSESDKLGAIGAIATIITTLSGSTLFRTQLTPEQMENAKLTFDALGGAIVAFSDSISTLSEDAVDKAQKAAEIGSTLSALENNLPRTGGKLQDWIGEKDLGDFSYRISMFGAAIVAFSAAVTGENGESAVNEDSVKAAANAGKLLNDLNTSLPTTGGKLQEWLGEQDLAHFSSQIILFGQAIVDFSEIVTGEDGKAAINENAVKVAANAGKLLSDLQNSLPSTGGKIAEWLFGSKDLGVFATNIKDLAQGLVDFSTKTKDITPDSVKGAVSVLDTIASLDTSNTGTGGLLGLFAGTDGSLKNFADQLVDLGAGLADFQFQLGGRDWSSVYTALDVLETIAQFKDPSESFLKLTEGITKMLNDAVRMIKDSEKDFKIEATLVPKWIGLGFQQGVTKYAGMIKTAGTRIANMLEQSIKDKLEIHSPSVVMIEIGHYVIKGLAEGIEEDTSAEEAAKKKADNIVSAFKSMFDQISALQSTADYQSQLWELTHKEATDEETALAKRSFLNAQLQQQVQAVNTAKAEYEAIKGQLGAEATETQEAYNRLLQKQIEMYKLIDEMRALGEKEEKKTAEELEQEAWEKQQQRVEAFKKYAQLLQENYDAMINMGFSDQEIRELYMKESGWSPVDQLSEEERKAQEFKDLTEELIETALKGLTGEVQIEFLPPDPKKVEEEGKKVTTNVTNGIKQGVQTTQPEVKEAGENVVNGFVNGIKEKVDEAMPGTTKKVTEGAQALTDSLKRLLGEHSPSTVAYDIGENYIIGLKNGLTENVEGMDLIGAQIAEALNAGMAGLDSEGINMTSVGTQIMVSIGVGLQNGSESVIVAFQSVMANAHNVILSYTPQFKSAGVAIGMAIGDGIASTAAAVGARAAQVALQAYAAALGAVGGGGVGMGSAGAIASNYNRPEPVYVSGSGGAASSMRTGIVGATARDRAVSDDLRRADDARKSSSSGSTTTTNQTNNYNFTQNNTSPKSLNAADIYRQTKTQFARFKNLTDKGVRTIQSMTR